MPQHMVRRMCPVSQGLDCEGGWEVPNDPAAAMQGAAAGGAEREQSNGAGPP